MADERIRKLSIALEVLFITTLVYAPIAFGANAQVYRPPIWILAIAIFILTMIVYRGTKPLATVTSSNRYGPPILALWFFGGFLILQILMLIPLPAFALKLLGRQVGLEGMGFGTMHPDPEKGIRAILDWASVFVLFWSALTFPKDRKQVRRLIYAIMFVAGFEAIYGMIEFAGGHQYIFWFKKFAYLDSATGTFVNRNHFANFLVMSLCLSSGIFLYRWTNIKSKKSRDHGGTEKIFLLAFYAVLCASALLFSKSRGGLTSFLLAFTVIAFLFAKNHRKVSLIALVVVSVLVMVFSVWLNVDPTPSRFADLPEDISEDYARPQVWLQSIAVWSKTPIFGHGSGMFEDAFRTFGPKKILVRYAHAHNDYLEIAVEFGLVGLLLLFGGIFVVMRMIFAGLSNRQSRFARMIGQGAAAAIIATLLHGLTDFNFQIPANRLTFFVILGLGYMATRRSMLK